VRCATTVPPAPRGLDSSKHILAGSTSACVRNLSLVSVVQLTCAPPGRLSLSLGVPGCRPPPPPLLVATNGIIWYQPCSPQWAIPHLSIALPLKLSLRHRQFWPQVCIGHCTGLGAVMNENQVHRHNTYPIGRGEGSQHYTSPRTAYLKQTCCAGLKRRRRRSSQARSKIQMPSFSCIVP
jgi:hypothetical protein